MRLEDYERKVFDETMGLYNRGEVDQTPEDHFFDSVNLDYEIGEWRTRAGLSTAIVLGYGDGNGKVRRFVSFGDPGLGPIILILDNDGNLYTYSGRLGDIAKTPKLSISATAVDFSAIKMLGKIYIAFHDGNHGLSGVNLKVFIPGITPNLDEIRDAAGLAPINTVPITAVDGAAGIVNVGVYKIAVSYVTTSGFVTPPGPKISGTFTPTTYTAPGSKKINLSNIQTGPSGTAKRQILITKAGLDEYFFLPSAFGGLINDNITTTAILNFDDTTDLVDSADYLFDLLETIPASLVLQDYSTRLVLGGDASNSSVLSISRPGEPESIDSIDGIYNVNKDDGFTIRNLHVIRNTLYIWKNLGVFSADDNGDVPSSWNKPTVIDLTANVGVHGIAEFFDISGIRLSRDWTLAADVSGIVLFDGIVRKPSITHKINDLWQTINYNKYHNIVLIVDEKRHKIYCSIPTDFSSENNVLIVGDYNLCPGKVPEANKIKWSTWRFSPCGSSIRPTEIGLFGISPDVVPTFKIGSIDGGGKIWRLDPDCLLDDGNDIESSFQTSPLFWENGWVHFFTAARFRVIGLGSILGDIQGEDGVLPASIPTITLTSFSRRFILEDPPGVIDGVNVTYRPCNASCPVFGNFVGLFQNGLLLRNGTDYSIDSVTKIITMTSAPQSFDTLFILGSKNASFIVETPTGSINGSNVTFTLSQTPATTVLGWQNGLLLRNGVDFTVSATTVTMTTAPATNDTLQFMYSVSSSDSSLSAEIPSGSIDGLNTKYTLANFSTESVLVFWNGLLVHSPHYYILKYIKKNVIMTSPPQTNDTIQVVYFTGDAVGSGQEKLIRFNFQNEKAKLQFRMTSGRFIMTKAEFFGKPIYQMRPL